MIEGARKILSKPVKKKEPVTIEVMKMLYTQFGNSQELAKIRIYCMFSLAFSGFLRFNELVNIRFKDIRFCPSHVELFIPRSKTDIFREGNKLYIARTNKNTCPVACLKNYIKVANILEADEFLFRAMQFRKGAHCLSSCNKPISYCTVRELFKSSLESIGVEKEKFVLQSLRSGGATSAANNLVPDRLFKIHGRWNRKM